MHWQPAIYAFVLILLAVLSAGIALLGWQRRQTPTAPVFALMMGLVAVWQFTYALELLSATLPEKVFWDQIEYLGATVPVLLFIWTLQFTGRERWLTRRTLALLALEPALLMVAVWTNPFHHLIWTEIALDPSFDPPLLVLTHGPLTWLHAGISYLLMLVSSSLLGLAYYRSVAPYRLQACLAASAGVFPWFSHVIYLLQLFPLLYFDPTPLGFAVSGLLFGASIFRFRFLDLAPVAREAVIESMGDAMIVLDAQSRVVELNPSAVKLFGKSAGEWVGQQARDLFSAWPEWEREFGAVLHAQTERALPGPETQWVDLNLRPLYDRQNRVTGRLILLHDVTARKRAEEAKTALLAAIPDLMFRLDDEGRLIDYSAPPGAHSIAAPDQMIGRRLTEALPPQMVAPTAQALKTARRTGQVQRLEYETNGGGPRRNWEARLVPNESGEILAMVREVTDIKRAQEAIRESEEQHRTIVAALAEGVLVLDEQGVIHAHNPSAETLLGVATRELSGRPWHGLYAILSHEDGSPYAEATDPVLGTLRTGQRTSNHIVLVTRGDGMLATLSLNTQPLVRAGDTRPFAVVASVHDVTAQRRADAAVRQKEAHFRSLIENSLDSVEILNSDGTLVYISPSVERVLGYRPQDMIGQNGFQIIHPDDLPRVMAIFRELVPQPGATRSLELRCLHADGQYRILEAVAKNLLHDPAVVGIVLNFRDSTLRKRAEAALRASEEQLRVITDSMSDMVCRVSLDGTFEYVSPSHERILGYTPSALIGTSMFTFMHPEDSKRMYDVATRIVAGEVVNAVEYRYRHAQGHFVWLESGGNLVFDTQGCPTGAVITTRDITARKHSEALVRKLSTAVQQIPSSIFITDAEGMIEYVNPQFVKMTGYMPEEVIGRAPAVLRPEGMSVEPYREILESLRQGRGWRGEIPSQKKNGEVFWVSSVVSPIHSPEGVVTNYVGVEDDITQRKKTMTDLQAFEAQSRLQNSALEAAANGIVITDADGKILWVNHAFSVLTGYDRAEARGGTPRLLKSGRQEPAFYRQLWETITSGQVWRGELINRRQDGSNYTEEMTITPVRAGGREITHFIAIKQDVTARKRASERLGGLNECLLSFEASAQKNIDRLIAFLGEELGGTCALYNTLDNGLLCSFGRWNTPPDYRVADRPEGHICYDIIRSDREEPWVIRNLAETAYAETDPNVRQYGLQTYVGCPVVLAGHAVGSVCVVYQQDHAPSEDDLRLLAIVSSAVGVEEGRRRAEDALHRRDAILEAVSFAAEEILQAAAWEDSIEDVLERLGRAAQVSRAYLFQNLAASDGSRFASQKHEWVAAGITPQIGNPTMQNGSLDSGWLARWGEFFVKGQPVYGATREFPADERPSLESQGIRSILAVPILASGEWWGFIGFDECAQDREWLPSEREALRTAAGILGGAIEHQRGERELTRRAGEMSALYKTARDLAAQGDVPTLLETIVDRAIALLGASGGSIYLYDSAHGDLVARVSRGVGVVTGFRLKMGEGIAGRVARTHLPMWVDDYQKWEHRLAQYDDVPYRAILQVPMLFGGELIGVLSVHETGSAERCFTETDAQLLSLFAGHAASAVHNAHLLQETRTRAEQLGLLYDAGLTVNRMLEPRAQLEFLVQIAQRALHADRAEYFQFQPGTGILDLQFALGYPPEFTELLRHTQFSVAVTKGIVGEVALRRVPLILADAKADPRWVTLDPEIRSGLWVCVEHEDQVLGVLGMLSTRLQAFTPADERLLVLFANQAAIALENGHLFAETRRRAEQMAVLNDITRTSLSSQDLPSMLQTLADRLGELIGADSTYLTLWDEARDLVIPMAASGSMRDMYAQTIGELGERTMTRSCLEAGRPLVAEDVLQSPYIDPRIAALYPSRSLVALPLIAGERKLGAALIAFHEPHHFTPEEVSLSEQAAAQIAIAVAQVKLLHETRRRADQLAVLNRIASAVNHTVDLDDLLEVIYTQISLLLRSDACFIALYDEATQELNYRVMVDRGVRERPDVLKLQPGLTAHAVQTRRPLLIRDWNREQSKYPPMSLWGSMEMPQSILTVPMQTGETIVGILSLQAYTPNTFGEEDQALLSTVAEQAAVAIAKARLYEQARQRLQDLEAVNRVSIALRTAGTLDEMLPRLLDETLAVLRSDAGSIRLYDPADNLLHQRASRGWFVELEGTAQGPGEGIAGRVMLSGQGHLSAEFKTDPETHPRSQAIAPAGYGGACVPIRTAGEVVGVLFVSVQHPRELKPEEMHLLNTLAEIAGNAIHRTRLHERTEQHLQRMTAMHTIDTAISASLDLHVTLNVLLDQVLTQLQVHATDILLLNAQTQTLDYAAGRGFHSRALQYSRVRLGEGRAGLAALERRIVRVPNLPADIDGLARSPLIGEEKFVAYFAVPLVAKGQVKGVLEIFHRAPLDPDEEWFNFLKTVSEQAAIAIDNASLFEQLQHSNTELALAYDTTLEGWSKALELRDQETEGHTLRVTETTLRLARRMGMSEAELVHVRRGALLHDIGKVGVPDSILLKPGPLDESEWKIMRRHPTSAFELLSPIPFLRRAIDVPYCHHEKWDGTGYPRGLKGEQIPLAARVFAVVDIWDALCSDRPYRRAWEAPRVREYIHSLSGAHLDPRVVEAFLELEAEQP